MKVVASVIRNTPDAPSSDLGADPAADAALRDELAEVRRALRATQRLVQEQRENEAMLRAELQHRVRNILAVVRSIFTRSAARGGDLQDLADHFHGRLDVLARMQVFRTADPASASDLEGMLHEEMLSVQADRDPRVSFSGPTIRLPHEAAQVIGLAFHELATNSIKFGVLSSSAEHARLVVEWSHADDRLEIAWRESGIAAAASTPLPVGFGREFIEDALPYQLGAETRFDLTPRGLFCAISIPTDEWATAYTDGD